MEKPSNCFAIAKIWEMHVEKKEKPSNCFATAKIWEMHVEKKEILRNGPASLLISLWDRFQFLLVQAWFLRKRNIDSK